MKIVHLQVKDEGTVAKRIPSTTAGLTSAYQKMGNATLGASAVATTGGYILLELASIPWQSPVAEPYLDFIGDFMMIGKEEAAEGYEVMGSENTFLAEEFLPIALEAWPTWKD